MSNTVGDHDSITSSEVNHLDNLSAEREVEFTPGFQAASKNPHFRDTSGLKRQGGTRSGQLTPGRGVENEVSTGHRSAYLLQNGRPSV